MTVWSSAEIAEQIRLAFSRPDLSLLSSLLHPQVRWGDVQQPGACRSRADVLVTFARLLGEGVTAEVVDLSVLPGGVVAHLRVRWPEPRPEKARLDVFQSYRVEHSLITEIRGHDDATEAARDLT